MPDDGLLGVTADDINRWLATAGRAVSGGPSATSTLSPEQETASDRRGLLNFGLSLLMNSGPSSSMRSTGQIIGQGISDAMGARQAGEREVAGLDIKRQSNLLDALKLRNEDTYHRGMLENAALGRQTAQAEYMLNLRKYLADQDRIQKFQKLLFPDGDGAPLPPGALPRMPASLPNLDGSPGPQASLSQRFPGSYDLASAGGDYPVPGDDPLRALIIDRESKGNPAVVNDQGYAGLYQMGTAALAAANLYNPGRGESLATNQWGGTLNIPGFPQVRTLDDFRRSPEAQHAAYERVRDAKLAELEARGAFRAIGTPIDGVPVTKEGLLMGSWLGGAGGVEKVLSGRGDPADSNGTRVSDYIKAGSRLVMPGGGGPVPQNMAARNPGAFNLASVGNDFPVPAAVPTGADGFQVAQALPPGVPGAPIIPQRGPINAPGLASPAPQTPTSFLPGQLPGAGTSFPPGPQALDFRTMPNDLKLLVMSGMNSGKDMQSAVADAIRIYSERQKQQIWRVAPGPEASVALGTAYDPRQAYRVDQWGKYEPINSAPPNINVNTATNPAAAAVAEADKQALVNYRTAAAAARGMQGKINLLEGLEPQIGNTGPATALSQPVSSFLTSLGIGTKEQQQLAADRQLYEAISKGLSRDLFVPGSGSVSDYEGRMFIQQVPNLGQPKETNRMLAAGLRQIAQRKIDESSIANQLMRRDGNLFAFDDEVSRLGPLFKTAPSINDGVTARQLDAFDATLKKGELYIDSLGNYRIWEGR